MDALEGVVRQVAEALLGMGWRGVVTALVLLVAWVLVRSGVKALPAPTAPAPPRPMPDVADDPDRPSAEWNQDPVTGAVVKPHDDPDDRPPG